MCILFDMDPSPYSQKAFEQSEHTQIFKATNEQLVDRALKGDFQEMESITSVVRRLCTQIDDIPMISDLVKSLLRRELELNYEDDQRMDPGDMIYHPVTEEYAGDAIFNHPDAHAALESFKQDLTGGILDGLYDAGKIDDLGAVRLADESAKEHIERGDSTSWLEKQEKSTGNIGDTARQWQLVIESFMAQTTKRNYAEELSLRAHARWKEGVVTREDGGFRYYEMIGQVSDPATVELLIDAMVSKSIESWGKDRADAAREFQLNYFKFYALGLFDRTDSPEHKNAELWVKKIDEYMVRAGVVYDPDKHRLTKVV